MDRRLFPVRYSISGGRPAVDLSFTIEEGGEFVVDVANDYALGQTPPVRLGSFGGRLAPEVQEKLLRTLREAPAGAAGRLPFETVIHSVSRGGGPALTLSAGNAVAELDHDLAGAARQALASPKAAVEVGAVAPGSGNGVLRITGLGVEALPVILFSSDVPGQWMRLWRDDAAQETGRVYLSFDEIQALAEAGRLPRGRLAVDPGTSIELPLPADSVAGTTGGFTFWRAGPGSATRLLSGSWALAE